MNNCISSYLMTSLIHLRNPQRDRDFMYQKQEMGNLNTFYAKVILAEIGFVLCTTVAVIETLALTIFLSCSWIYGCPIVSSKKLLRSSSFTIFWGAGNVIMNLFIKNLLPTEAFVRHWIERRMLFSLFTLCNQEEIEQIVHWQQIILGFALRQEFLAFIFQDVLHEISKDNQKKIQEYAPGIMYGILRKAIFIYSFGKKKSEEIPRFFCPTIQIAIEYLRKHQAPSIEFQTEVNSFGFLENIGKELYFSKSLNENYKESLEEQKELFDTFYNKYSEAVKNNWTSYQELALHQLLCFLVSIEVKRKDFLPLEQTISMIFNIKKEDIARKVIAGFQRKSTISLSHTPSTSKPCPITFVWA